MPIDQNGVMVPQMADGEVIDPTPMDESVEMEVEPEPGIQQEDPPLEEEDNAPELMEQDEDEDEGAKEPSSDDDLGWFVDRGLEPDSEDEAAAALEAQEAGDAQAMESEAENHRSTGPSVQQCRCRTGVGSRRPRSGARIPGTYKFRLQYQGTGSAVCA